MKQKIKNYLYKVKLFSAKIARRSRNIYSHLPAKAKSIFYKISKRKPTSLSGDKKHFNHQHSRTQSIKMEEISFSTYGKFSQKLDKWRLIVRRVYYSKATGYLSLFLSFLGYLLAIFLIICNIAIIFSTLTYYNKASFTKHYVSFFSPFSPYSTLSISTLADKPTPTDKSINFKIGQMDSSDTIQIGSPLKHTLYTVQQNDTLWDISKKTGMSVDSILSYNHMKFAHHLALGDTLKIPLSDGIMHKKNTKGRLIASEIEELSDYYSVPSEKIAFFNIQNDSEYAFIPDVSLSMEQRVTLYGRDFGTPLARYSRVSSLFGFRIHPVTKKRSFHSGLDIATPVGTPVYAAKNGKINSAGWATGYGLQVTIFHGNGLFTRYAHLSKITTPVGKRVTRGSLVGLSGNTGISTGPHLHFEIIRNGKKINPYYMISLKK